MALEAEHSELAHLLASHPELAHVQIRKHGQSLILYQQDEHGPENLIRFTRLTRSQWTLSFALHTGRWEATPFEDTLPALFTMVLDQFGFTLAKR
jgi:hypothetical protein